MGNAIGMSGSLFPQGTIPDLSPPARGKFSVKKKVEKVVRAHKLSVRKERIQKILSQVK